MPWLASYPTGIPAEINIDAYSSLADVIEQSCQAFSNNVAYRSFGQTLTFAELDQASQAFANYLQTKCGVEKGDRVALMMPNLLQYPVALFGILRIGAVVVNVNPLYTPRELHHQLDDSGAKVIIVLENFAHTVQQVLAEVPTSIVIVTRLGDMVGGLKGQLINIVVKYLKRSVPRWSFERFDWFKNALRDGETFAAKPVKLNHDDLAFLQYTGGTTGVAKGAMLSHGNMVANLEQASAWLGTALTTGKEAVITALPLYHIFSLTANCLVFMKLGGENILITNPRDLPAFIKTLKNTRFTALTGVNTLFNALLHTPGFADINFSSLKLTLGGGMAVQRSVAHSWQQVTRSPLLEAYGLTETSPAVCINPLIDGEFNGSIGLPIPSTVVTVRGEHDDEQMPSGDIGELCVHGPQVMKGYWQRPEETIKVMTSDGALRTGDMGYIDAKGYVFLTDRKKDMILVSGFNVYPNEVEEVVVSHPDVIEAAAVGVPDAHSGEIVKVYVVRKNDLLTEQMLIDFCQKNMTRYKVPKQVEFRDHLPKTNVGKILRRALRSGEQT
ncbi:MAG: AMP-binding protein [Gammaproteobacteria bacterium]|nr:AMP-binding protein [Gammaproteobacteria bacterium]